MKILLTLSIVPVLLMAVINTSCQSSPDMTDPIVVSRLFAESFYTGDYKTAKLYSRGEFHSEINSSCINDKFCDIDSTFQFSYVKTVEYQGFKRVIILWREDLTSFIDVVQNKEDKTWLVFQAIRSPDLAQTPLTKHQ